LKSLQNIKNKQINFFANLKRKRPVKGKVAKIGGLCEN
jgi:hypothetical protein